MKHLLQVNNLSVSFKIDDSVTKAVNDVSYYIDQGETISFVGESGSGKSVSQLAVLQLISTPPGRIDNGYVQLEDEELLKYSANGPEMRKIRGGRIGMVFQEPMTSLNPVKTIGSQLLEPIVIHTGMNEKEARKRAISLLSQVGIPDAEKRMGDYPHQFSGGMRQRIMVAIAIAGNPKLIIADEPTTALDVTTQAQILELLKTVSEKNGTALLIVTHNLGIVARYAQRIYVMYAGRIVESGLSRDIFAHPSHPYTRGLLNAIPRLDDSKERKLQPIDAATKMPPDDGEHCPFLSRCKYKCHKCISEGIPTLTASVEDGHFAACRLSREELDQIDKNREESTRVDRREPLKDNILEINNLSVHFSIRNKLLSSKSGKLTAVDNVSFKVKRGETFGLVGESGCGKTTVARSVVRLITDSEGEIIFNNLDLNGLKSAQLRKQRRKIQMIFQDPYSSLDPRKSAGSLVGEPLRIHKLVSAQQEYDRRVDELFTLVGLSPSLKNRVAHEFSGGQRQRLGIARALASSPDLIVCDEPISALDVSIQAQIINLLEDLQQELGLTYLFIAHDLSVVKHISDTIAVMYLGKIVETAPCEELYANPMHPYTQALLAAVPIPDPEIEQTRKKIILPGEVKSLMNRPAGCCFSDRCPYTMDICRKQVPSIKSYGNEHFVACHKLGQ